MALFYYTIHVVSLLTTLILLFVVTPHIFAAPARSQAFIHHIGGHKCQSPEQDHDIACHFLPASLHHGRCKLTRRFCHHQIAPSTKSPDSSFASRTAREHQEHDTASTTTSESIHLLGHDFFPQSARSRLIEPHVPEKQHSPASHGLSHDPTPLRRAVHHLQDSRLRRDASSNALDPIFCILHNDDSTPKPCGALPRVSAGKHVRFHAQPHSTNLITNNN